MKQKSFQITTKRADLTAVQCYQTQSQHIVSKLYLIHDYRHL